MLQIPQYKEKESKRVEDSLQAAFLVLYLGGLHNLTKNWVKYFGDQARIMVVLQNADFTIEF